MAHMMTKGIAYIGNSPEKRKGKITPINHITL
jgi:hypothetical protein